MDLYAQDAEAHLLSALVSRLDDRTVIDVGAERGAFVDLLLAAGSDAVHLVEPEPSNAAFLRRRFDGDGRVTVHEYALGDSEGEIELKLAVDARGDVVSFAHTVLDRPATDEIKWRGSVKVQGRTLASLIESRELPRRVGIVKIDTEGNDLAVVNGMGDLECDVLMVEHWRDLPHLLGPCPWTAGEMVGALAARGFAHFAFIERRGEFVILKWDNAEIGVGHVGNLVFVHERVCDRLLPLLLESATTLGEASVAVGEMYAAAARDRLKLIEALDRDCKARLRMIEELSEALERGEGQTRRRLHRA